ncbi:putative RNA-directed DNA polymerase from transposon BS [Trichonephila clavipes]|nr:putative RNA-directed DNA polymerase from transposon BS [Trichonephila clavipes]
MTLCAFINQTWKNGLPRARRKDIIIPILKSNKPAENMGSYHLISPTNITSKLTEGIIPIRLLHVLDKIEIISKRQADFQRHRRTSEQIVCLSQDIKGGFQKMQSTLSVFVDFKIEFDRVWRDGLLKSMADPSRCAARAPHAVGRRPPIISSIKQKNFVNFSK